MTVDVSNTSPDDRKEFIETCAAWDFAEWGCFMPQFSLVRAINAFSRYAEGDQLPMVWVCCKEDKPVGMVTLADEDHPDLNYLLPWLSALYVHPRFRHQGVGRALCAHVIEQASSKGFRDIYLYTATAGELYRKMGWRPMGLVRGPTGFDETLMALRLKVGDDA